MRLKELIENRYSVRAYLPQKVEKEKIEYILNCARLAPSANNYQPWFFYIITDDLLKSKITDLYDRAWFKTAPMYIVVCKDSDQAWKRSSSDNKDFGDIDTAITAQHICLAAADIGLGTCWVCNFDPNRIAEILNMSSNLEAIAIFPLGYINNENTNITEKKRKPLSEITKWD